MYASLSYYFMYISVPPVISSTNSPQITTIQSNVTLTCQSSGDPAPKFDWLNPRGQSVSSKYGTYKSIGQSVYDSTHMIQNITMEYIGQWTCRACNIMGCDESSVQIIVEGNCVRL